MGSGVAVSRRAGTCVKAERKGKSGRKGGGHNVRARVPERAIWLLVMRLPCSAGLGVGAVLACDVQRQRLLGSGERLLLPGGQGTHPPLRDGHGVSSCLMTFALCFVVFCCFLSCICCCFRAVFFFHVLFGFEFYALGIIFFFLRFPAVFFFFFSC